MMYALTVYDTESIGNDTDETNRIKSTYKYWEQVEESTNTFWIQALRLTREYSDNMLDNLYEHFSKNYQVFLMNEIH